MIGKNIYKNEDIMKMLAIVAYSYAYKIINDYTIITNDTGL